METPPVPTSHSFGAIVTLQQSRALLRTPAGRALAISVGFVYAFVSLIVGQMLIFEPTGQTQISYSVITAPSSAAWWNYPAVVVLAPGGIVALPFLPVITMVMVSIGVGLGMAVGVVLAARLLRMQRHPATGPTLASSAAGLTPAMLALVTLGACCSTTAAATAGIGAVAQASGQTLTTVFENTWYLGFFQMAVLGVALVAQEQLVVVYGNLAGETGTAHPAPDRRAVLTVLLRIALLAGGVTWLLAGLLEAVAPPAGAPFAVWATQVLLQHVVAGGVATVAGLFGPRWLPWFSARDLPRTAARLALGVAGVTMLLGTPPPLSGWGWSGFGNEFLGQIGVGGSLGGASPPFSGLALVLRWTFQLVLVGAFAIGASIAPLALAAPETYASPGAAVSG